MRLRLTPILALLLACAPAAHGAVHPRIIGGTPAADGTHAAVAALVIPGVGTDADGQFCGATAIAPYAFLTAAHCIVQPTQTLTPANFVVVAGKHDLAQTTGGERLAVRSVITSPTFDADTLVDDVAVVLTTTPTAATPFVRATATPGPGPATAVGWGATDPAGTAYSPVLLEAGLQIQAHGACGDPLFICAGTTSPNICIGDSGGPLLVTTLAGVRQVGISSAVMTPDAATPCGQDSSLFTDVAQHQAWIDAQLAPSVSGVTVAAVGGKLHVAWQLVPGGERPSVEVATTDGSTHVAPPGATSLDIAGLPPRTAVGATVLATNTWGSDQAASGGTALIVAPPSLSGVAVANRRIGGKVATNGAITVVKAQYGRDTAHLITTPSANLADAAAPTPVSISFGTLTAGLTYRARLVAESTAGTTVSSWITFVAPATRPVAKALPKLRGTAKVGKTLTCSRGTWTASPTPVFSYRWRIGSKVSKKYTGAKLKLTDALRGKKVSCVVTARNAAASVTARSTAVTVKRR